MGLFKRKYKPKVNDIVNVHAVADRKKLYRIDNSVPHKIVSVDKKNREVVVIKDTSIQERGVEGWTVSFEDIEPCKK